MNEIAFVTQYPCIRVVKEFYALSKKGLKVHLICGGTPFNPVTGNPKFQAMLESYTHCITDKQFEQAIKRMRDVTQIFHVHNEPNWPVGFVRESVPDAKIIFDMHDSKYWISDGEYIDEKLAIDSADYFVVPCEAGKKELAKRTGKNITVLYPACPVDWYVNIDHNPIGGLVSQGCHVIPNLGDRKYRDFTLLYRRLLENNINIYAFSAVFTNNQNKHPEFDITQHYAQLGCHVANADYVKLLEVLGNHDWNLVGNWQSETHKVWKYVMPNKLFDAIAGGIPSVNFNCTEVSKILDEHEIGMNCDAPSELIENWSQHYEFRKNLMSKRKDFCMENYIDEVVKLYEA